MCGFAGFVSFRPGPRRPAEREAILRAMGRQLARRGPDDETLFDDGTLALVFRRLSVVDVDRGRQPIWNEDRSAFVAVNGEIYNHHELRGQLGPRHAFSTRSDAEAALHLWEDRGPGFLHLLHGMFAIALYDARERRLLLARDRLGIKPLYYARTEDGLLFGSELKALLVHPLCPTELNLADVDLSYIDGPTYFPVTPGRQPTYVKGVEFLPAGHHLTFDARERADVTRWWSLEPALERSLRDPPLRSEAYVDGYFDLLADSVHRHLMSDVPVGALLSGGLDSSLVVALAARENRHLHCYSILEGTTLVSGDAERARRLTRSLGLPFHPVRFEPREIAASFSLETFEYFVWMMDGPKLDPDWLFKHELHRYAKTVTPEVKVVLLGQGADEFAGGYSRPNAIERTWNEHLERRSRVHHEFLLRAGGAPAGLAPFLRPPPAEIQHEDAREALEHLQYHNLWHEDRTSSSQGLEARVPYLDHRLVEFLAAIPPALHAELLLDKGILRDAARRCIPEEFAAAPKVPSWLSRDPSSTLEMMRGVARRVFPGFRESYGDSNLLDAGAMEELHSRTAAPGEASVASTKLLLALMSLAVFERLCKTLKDGHEVRALGPPSPLRAEPDFDATPPDGRADPKGLRAATVRLVPETRILFDPDGKEAYLARDSRLEATLEIGGDDAWVGAMLRRIDGGISTADLATALGRPVDEVADLAAELLDEGWIEVWEGPGGEGAR